METLPKLLGGQAGPENSSCIGKTIDNSPNNSSNDTNTITNSITNNNSNNNGSEVGSGKNSSCRSEEDGALAERVLKDIYSRTSQVNAIATPTPRDGLLDKEAGVLEDELTKGASEVYRAMLDLDVPDAHLAELWKHYSDIRQSLRVMKGKSISEAAPAAQASDKDAATSAGKAADSSSQGNNCQAAANSSHGNEGRAAARSSVGKSNAQKKILAVYKALDDALVRFQNSVGTFPPLPPDDEDIIGGSVHEKVKKAGKHRQRCNIQELMRDGWWHRRGSKVIFVAEKVGAHFQKVCPLKKSTKTWVTNQKLGLAVNSASRCPTSLDNA